MNATRNLFWQSFGQATNITTMFLFYILLPTAIGVEEYGRFSFTLAIVFILVQPLVEMGLDITVTKWVSRRMPGVVRKAFFIRLLASLGALLATLVVPFFMDVDGWLLTVLSLYFILASLQNIVFSFFRGVEDMRLEGILGPVQRLAALFFLWLLVALDLRTAGTGAYSLLFSALLGGVLVLLVSGRRLKETPVEGDLRYSDVVREGLLLGAVNFLWLIYFRVDSVMLGVMKGNFSVGEYNVAYRFMEAVIMMPAMIMSVYFPRLVKGGQFDPLFRRLLLMLGLLGVLALAGLFAASGGIIRFIYIQEFYGAIAVLKILSLAVPAIFVGNLVTQALVALDMTGTYLGVTLMGAVLNVFMNFLLIPAYGASGAAWATVVTELMVTLACGYFVFRKRPAVFKRGASVQGRG